MTYEPNFTDPRIRDRCLRVLEFIDLWLPAGQTRPIAKTQFLKWFGNCDRQGPGKWLRDHLLICQDSYYNMQTGRCKRWSQNTSAVGLLKQQLGLTEKIIKVTAEEQQQLDSGDIEYIEKSNRSYHRLQNLPKRQRRTLLSKNKMQYEYDIDACALTLLLQLARQLGLTKPVALLDLIIEDKQSVRQAISEELNLPMAVVKQIMASLLNGGKISSWHTNHIFALVNYNSEMIKQLQNSLLLQEYRKEVTEVWKAIRPSLNLSKGVRLSPKKKCEIYNQQERAVTDQIKRYLKKRSVRSFFIHDGWTCDRAIDTNDLTAHVRRTTGYNISFDWTIYEDDDQL